MKTFFVFVFFLFLVYLGQCLRIEHKAAISGQTSWFASPLVYDLDGDGSKEIISAYYSIYVYDKDLNLLDTFSPSPQGRVYAPHAICDLDGDGDPEIVFGNGAQVYALNWNGGTNTLSVKSGWPSSVYAPSQTSGVEVRGLSCADLAQDGSNQFQVIVTTTQTLDEVDGGSQVYVFDANGNSYQPSGATVNPSWPRYNYATGVGNDRDRNGCGLNGYGSYGLNVGIGNIDDDNELEIIATYDNHMIEAFKKDGVAIDTSDYFTSRQTQCFNQRLTWGQFIRWYDETVEDNHMHLHEGDWPNVGTGQQWLQWTSSPPCVADIDQDGKKEVIGIPNVELHEPYETMSYAFVVYNGSQDGGIYGGKRFPGFDRFPRGKYPIKVEGWYPPNGIPSPTIADVTGDGKLEIISHLNDGFIYCVNWKGELVWMYDYTHNRQPGRWFPFFNEPRPIYATEVTVADLDGDSKPEIIFATWGAADDTDSAFLVILNREGKALVDIRLPNPSHATNGNGYGAPTPPTIADIDGDGTLEVLVQTFEHGMDVFTLPDSAGSNCMLWPTSRGSHLRLGSPNDSMLTCGTSDPLRYTPLKWDWNAGGGIASGVCGRSCLVSLFFSFLSLIICE